MSGFAPEVSIKGLEELKRAARVMPNETGKALAQAQRTVAPVVQKMARGYAPRDKGQLHASIQIDGPTGSRLNVQTRIYTNLKHAIFQEFGTGIYGPTKRMIRPVRAKMLAWQSGGVWHRAKAVRGSKPHHFMEQSAKENTHRYWSHVHSSIKEVLAKLPK